MIDWDLLVGRPCVGIFGQPVLYTSATGQRFSILGVFDEAYTELTPLPGGGMMDVGDPTNISTTRPVLGVQLAGFLVQPRQGDLLAVAGQLFWVREVRPDGHGAAKLMLNVAEGQMP